MLSFLCFSRLKPKCIGLFFRLSLIFTNKSYSPIFKLALWRFFVWISIFFAFCTLWKTIDNGYAFDFVTAIIIYWGRGPGNCMKRCKYPIFLRKKIKSNCRHFLLFTIFYLFGNNFLCRSKSVCFRCVSINSDYPSVTLADRIFPYMYTDTYVIKLDWILHVFCREFRVYWITRTLAYCLRCVVGDFLFIFLCNRRIECCFWRMLHTARCFRLIGKKFGFK